MPANVPSIHVHFPNPTSTPQLSITTSQPSPTVTIEPIITTTTIEPVVANTISEPAITNATIKPAVTTPKPAQPARTTTEPVIDLTGEAEEFDIIHPTISELLAELDESMPALGFTRYEGLLLAAGFSYVHQIVDTPTIRTTLRNLEVPIGVADEVIERAWRMMRRASKSTFVIKNEDHCDQWL